MEDYLPECFHPEKRENNAFSSNELIKENNQQQIINLLVKNGEEIRCIKSQLSALNTINKNLYSVYASLASTNQMAVAANYPTLVNRIVVYTTNITFKEMLNPNLVVLFKDSNYITEDLPVYVKDISDTTGYNHIVTFEEANIEHQATNNQLVNNYLYPALYVGNYIVLNPTQQTLDDFKNGLLN